MLNVSFLIKIDMYCMLKTETVNEWSTCER